MFASFVCLRWVLPEEMGVWKIMVLIESYILLARFGVFNAFNREFPYFLGKGENDRAVVFLNTAESFALVLCVFFLLIIPLSLLFYEPSDEPLWRVSILTLAIYVPFNVYRNFLDLTYRTSKEFRKLAIVQMWLILITIVSIWFVYKYGYSGYLIRLIFMGVASILVYSFYRAHKFGPSINWTSFKYLFVEGLPLFASNYLQNIIKSFPAMFVLYFGGTTILGLFTPVLAILGLGLLLPSSIGVYLLPTLNFSYGEMDNKQRIVRDGLMASLYSIIIVAPIILLLWNITPWLVETYLPEYSSVSNVMCLALIVGLLASFRVSFNVFTVLKAWSNMFKYLIFVLVVNVLIPVVLIRLNYFDDLLITIIVSLIIIEILAIISSIVLIKSIS